MPKLKKRQRRPRELLTDGIQKAIRFPQQLHDDILDLADREDRDFAAFVRREMQGVVDEKKAEKRPIYAS